MGLNQAGWPTVCPRCQSAMDWVHTESKVDNATQKQTAYFVPVCVRNCTQDQMKLTRKEYPNLSREWRPRRAHPLPQGVKVSSYLS